MIVHQVVGIAVFLCIGIGSALLYEPDHRSRDYARGRSGAIPSPAGFRPFYHWLRFSTVGLGCAALAFGTWPWLTLFVSAWTVYVGSVTALAGFGLFVAAKAALGSQYSPCFDAYLPTRLVSRGVYRWVRHPIYTANVVTLCGLTLASGSPWLAVNLLLLAVYYCRTVRVEEVALGHEVDGYEEYRQRTGRFLPRLRRASYSTSDRAQRKPNAMKA